ncbi:MAG TPA: flagellar assembly peptidoglycan hydrolase FlgJ [Steroidobacteraceae bacterium]|nr:flagellar assembly peptidoglycan hydrolase FlgJ [Steroidobacteraceae bacterium]
MSLPIVDPHQLAAAGNLAGLKQAAANQSPQALREAAVQFESLFTSMVLKSMRAASFKDPIFGSDQEDLYQEMYDDQVAAEMSKGKGLGLADMLVQQLRRGGIGGADSAGATPSQPLSQSAAGAGTTGSTAANRLMGVTTGGGSRAGASANASASADANASADASASADARTSANALAAATGSTASALSATTGTASCPTSAQQAEFARALWPDAQQAARQLGVSPVTLLAQAALETDWGRKVPQNAGGATSNNLFGIKATSGWTGSAVTNSTREFSGGRASTVSAAFRSYDSAGHCFQDYVELLRSNPRYEAALGTGNDVQAFGSALQQGGYATDPAYASKLTAVAGTMAHALTRAAAAGPVSAPLGSLKFAASLPTTDGSGTLQRR